MKKIILLVFMIVFFKAHAAYAEKKVYTQAEFDKKVEETVNKKIDRIKKSSISQLTKEILLREKKIDKMEVTLKSRTEQVKIAEGTLAKKILG